MQVVSPTPMPTRPFQAPENFVDPPCCCLLNSIYYPVELYDGLPILLFAMGPDRAGFRLPPHPLEFRPAVGFDNLIRVDVSLQGIEPA